jgi:hypothetical protein
VTTIQQRLDERYGRTSARGKRAGWIVVGVVAAAALGWVAWTTISASAGTVDYDDLGYEVRDEHEVSVTFQVTSSQQHEVTCVLEALDAEFGIVGWRIVELPASERVSVSYTESIPTVAEATTGIVNSCWVP